MTRMVRTEVRKRGFFGWVFMLLFIGFNLLMLAWLISYWATIAPMVNQGHSAARTGAALGATIGTGFLIALWAAGDIILGLLTLLSRGKKLIVEEVIQ